MGQQLRQYLIGDGAEQRVPEVHEPAYDAFSKAVVKADLHGACIKVTASKCPSLVGQTGIVAMETKNSFKIVGRDNRTRSEYSEFCTVYCPSKTTKCSWNSILLFYSDSKA